MSKIELFDFPEARLIGSPKDYQKNLRDGLFNTEMSLLIGPEPKKEMTIKESTERQLLNISKSVCAQKSFHLQFNQKRVSAEVETIEPPVKKRPKYSNSKQIYYTPVSILNTMSGNWTIHFRLYKKHPIRPYKN